MSSKLPDTEFEFNQFLIDDERPALISTGTYGLYEGVRDGVAEVLDPSKLEYAIVLHFDEADEKGAWTASCKGRQTPRSRAAR